MHRFRKRKMINELKKADTKPSTKNGDKISAQIEINEEKLKSIFKNCSDLVIRSINVSGELKILVVYFDGLVDSKTLDEVFLMPMMFAGLPNGLEKIETIGEVIEQQLIAVGQVSTVWSMNEIIDGVLKANVAIIVDGEPKGIMADLKGFEHRGIEEPATEVTIRGPRDSFTESFRTNTALLRRRIRSPKFKMEPYTIGEFSKTDVALAYIEGIATDSLLEEVRKRMKRIQIDGVLDSEFIEEFIEDVPYSPFPQIQNTERPDVVAANLMEGRVAILVDNTPDVLILPMTFWGALQAAEDYYERFIYSTFIRGIRYFLLNVSLYLPAIYVALTTFHPRLIPTNLLISIAAAREGIPFPAIVEAMIMEFMFEGLREAGIRLPKAVGSAVSIVGALVIGQAAVQAGIVSASMVIVVSTTGIASFAIPRYNFGTAFRLLKFILLILAGGLGLYGVLIGFIIITIHLVNLRSFGVPYFSPIAPQIPSKLKDVLVRAPRWTLQTRPLFTAGRNKMRIPPGQKPSPKQGEKKK